tara:strand:+ start:151 stop:357 length:207 start_codon:yes stop_codon:yes gene_type:complete
MLALPCISLDYWSLFMRKAGYEKKRSPDTKKMRQDFLIQQEKDKDIDRMMIKAAAKISKVRSKKNNSK